MPKVCNKPVSIVFISLLRMRKPRHREVKVKAKNEQRVSGKDQRLDIGILTLESVFSLSTYRVAIVIGDTVVIGVPRMDPLLSKQKH